MDPSCEKIGRVVTAAAAADDDDDGRFETGDGLCCAEREGIVLLGRLLSRFALMKQQLSCRGRRANFVNPLSLLHNAFRDGRKNIRLTRLV